MSLCSLFDWQTLSTLLDLDATSSKNLFLYYQSTSSSSLDGSHPWLYNSIIFCRVPAQLVNQCLVLWDFFFCLSSPLNHKHFKVRDYDLSISASLCFDTKPGYPNRCSVWTPSVLNRCLGKYQHESKISKNCTFPDARSYHPNFRTHSPDTLQSVGYCPTAFKNMTTEAKRWALCVQSHHLGRVAVIFSRESILPPSSWVSHVWDEYTKIYFGLMWVS